MTDGKPRTLSEAIVSLVRTGAADGARLTIHKLTGDDGNLLVVKVQGDKGVLETAPDLTEGQRLGLSALLGDNVTASALADFLIEQGHDWATAVYQKAKNDALAVVHRRADELRRALGGPGVRDATPAQRMEARGRLIELFGLMSELEQGKLPPDEAKALLERAANGDA